MRQKNCVSCCAGSKAHTKNKCKCENCYTKCFHFVADSMFNVCRFGNFKYYSSKIKVKK